MSAHHHGEVSRNIVKTYVGSYPGFHHLPLPAFFYLSDQSDTNVQGVMAKKKKGSKNTPILLALPSDTRGVDRTAMSHMSVDGSCAHRHCYSE
jgi:hypothetical protein